MSQCDTKSFPEPKKKNDFWRGIKLTSYSLGYDQNISLQLFQDGLSLINYQFEGLSGKFIRKVRKSGASRIEALILVDLTNAEEFDTRVKALFELPADVHLQCSLAFKGVADLQPYDTVGLLAAAKNCFNGLQSVEGGLGLKDLEQPRIAERIFLFPVDISKDDLPGVGRIELQKKLTLTSPFQYSMRIQLRTSP
jgi:hypothetical protein